MSLSAERNEQFSEKSYWEQRYANPDEADFDWFKSVSLPLSSPFFFVPCILTLSQLYLFYV